MYYLKNKFLIAILFIITVISFGMCFSFSLISETALADSSPIYLSGASIKLIKGESTTSAIRFHSVISKLDYNDLVTEYGDLEIITRIVPAYILGDIKLTHETVLADKSKGDIKNVILTDKQFEVGDNYEFRCYVNGIPTWGYYREIVAMTYITDESGVFICESASLTRSIGTVAEIAIDDVSDEQTEKYEYEVADGVFSPYSVSDYSCIQGYVDSVAPIVTASERQITVSPSSTFTLNKTNLGLTVTDDKTSAPEITYSIEHNTVKTDLEEGETFDTEEYGVYIVDATATDDAGNTATERVVLTVDGTYVTDFDEMGSLSGTWSITNSSAISLVEFNGGKAISFTPNNWYPSWDIPLVNYDDELEDGDEIRIGFDVYLTGTFSGDGDLLLLETSHAGSYAVEGYSAYTEFLMGKMVTDQRKAHFELITRAIETTSGFRIKGFNFLVNRTICSDMCIYIDNITVINEKITYDWTYTDANCDGRDVKVTKGFAEVESGKFKVTAEASTLNLRFYNKGILESLSAGTDVSLSFDLNISQDSGSGKTIRMAYLNGSGTETIITPTTGSEYRVKINTSVVTTKGGYVNSTVSGSGLPNIMLYFVSTADGDIIKIDNLEIRTNQDYLEIDASSEFELTAKNLGLLSISDDETLTHTVTYNGVDSVTLTDNAFTSASSGYYEVVTTVTATGKEYYTLLVVKGSFVYGLNGLTSLPGTWVCSGSTGSFNIEDDGNKAWKLVPNQTTTAATNVNIPALNIPDSMQNKEVLVSFIVKVNGKFNSAAGWGTLLFESTMASTKILSQQLISGTNLEGGVYKVTMRTTLAYDSGVSSYRIGGFKFTTYGSAINPSYPVSLYFDNIVCSWDTTDPVATISDREIEVDASSTITLNAANLGLSFDRKVTLSFTVKENGSENVDVSSGTLTTGSSGYYDVTITATGDSGTYTTVYLLLYVNGTYVYGFNNIDSLTGTWVCNTPDSKSLYTDAESGNKSWKIVPKQTIIDAYVFNIPALDIPAAMQGQTVNVSFIVKVEGSFDSDANWTFVVEKTGSTSSVSTELIEGTAYENGVYLVNLMTTLNYDSGARNYRINGFKITVRGAVIVDPVALYIDNIMISLP